MNELEDKKGPSDKMQSEDTRAQSVWKKAGMYLSLLFFTVAAFFVVRYYDISSLKALLDKYEKFGFIICLLAYPVLGATFIPTDPITLLVLAWKGPVAAILLATIGNTLSAVEEYYIGYSVGDMADFEKKKSKLPFHLGRLPINSPGFLIFARMLPGFGAKFVGLAGGMYDIPMSTFIWTALVSNLIGAVMLVFGGCALIQLFKRIPAIAGLIKIVPECRAQLMATSPNLDVIAIADPGSRT